MGETAYPAIFRDTGIAQNPQAAKEAWEASPSPTQEANSQLVSESSVKKRWYERLRNLREGIAIDLGTENTSLAVDGKLVTEFDKNTNTERVVAVKGYIAFDIRKRRKDKLDSSVLCIGAEAKKLLEESVGNRDIVVVKIVEDGVISDYESAKIFIKMLLKQYLGMDRWLKLRISPRIIIGLPPKTNWLTRDRMMSSFKEATHAAECYIVEQAVASLIGGGGKYTGAECSTVLDMGSGTSDIGIYNHRYVIGMASIPKAGTELDQAIKFHLQSKHKLEIGLHQAEEIKIAIGAALPLEELPVELRPKKTLMEVTGKNFKTQEMNILNVTTNDVAKAIDSVLGEIERTLHNEIKQVAPALYPALKKAGILITGGSAQLHGIGYRIGRYTGQNTVVPDNASYAGILGLSRILRSKTLLNQVSEDQG